MKKGTKIILVVLAVVIIVGGVFLTKYLLSVKNYQDAVASITYQNENAKDVPDGAYIGEYDADFIYAKVEVAVADGKIEDIKLLEHRNEKGKEAEKITDRIISEQKVDVDAVTSATNSSNVIKKAVDNALTSGASGGNNE